MSPATQGWKTRHSAVPFFFFPFNIYHFLYDYGFSEILSRTEQHGARHIFGILFFSMYIFYFLGLHIWKAQIVTNDHIKIGNNYSTNFFFGF